MHKWHNGEKLKEEVEFVIFERPGTTLEDWMLPKNYTRICYDPPAISSTEVRNIIKWKEPSLHKSLLKDKLDLTNLAYIHSQALYST